MVTTTRKRMKKETRELYVFAGQLDASRHEACQRRDHSEVMNLTDLLLDVLLRLDDSGVKVSWHPEDPPEVGVCVCVENDYIPQEDRPRSFPPSRDPAFASLDSNYPLFGFMN